ncbi:MAG: NERD domain-containing protein [Planctomycetaceae bacterium]|nr:NERD domain-containing protein [Planctomycetaceae bacterium]
MTKRELERIVQKASCRVFGWEDASNESHRQVLAEIIRTTHTSDTLILCEPSLTRSTTRPPDIVIVCPLRGIAVVEVKGFDLGAITSIDPGGGFVLHYEGGARGRNPFHQVRNAMFDIKDAAQRVHAGTLNIPFRYFVAMPRIKRVVWTAKWRESAPTPEQLIFQEDLSRLSPALLQAGMKRLEAIGRETWPAADLSAIQCAFGDTSVLFPIPEERPQRRVRETTLGEMFDEGAEVYKVLSDEQQKLSAQFWERGPRIVRGVAGSGKTIVLANNLARRIHRLERQPELFEERKDNLSFLVVCFNRTLVPFVEKKIETAYRQRTGASLPDGAVRVMAFNRLMWHLAEKGIWRYQKVFEKGKNDRDRAIQYLADLDYVKQNDTSTFDAFAYDAIYCDEGQDFLEEEFTLLSQLLRRNQTEPSLFVFYDDAQNLYGRARPNWQSLGLNVVGQRSHIMTECFRNTRQIVEVAFNVLYGTFAEHKSKVPSRAFGDVSTLVDKGLITEQDGYKKVHFAQRSGGRPIATAVPTENAENIHILNRLRWLIDEQEVRPEDILILGFRKERIEQLAVFLRSERNSGLPEIHVAFKEKDEILGQRHRLTMSTVASAKGYDAYCVLLVSACEFKTDVDSRATFYVACTRAIEYLEVTTYGQPDGLFAEFQHAIDQV